jgi:hypothetical protein
MSAYKPFPVTAACCRKRIADARLIGWVALAESWQRDLDRLKAEHAARRHRRVVKECLTTEAVAA